MMTKEEIELSVGHAKQKARLEWYETAIERSGKALVRLFVDLKNDPLQPYLLNNGSFEEYCKERWNMTERRLRQLTAAETVKDMLTLEAPELESQIDRLNERQLRVLHATPEEKRAEVLREAMKVPGVTTATKLKKVRTYVLDPQGKVTPEKEEKLCPTCGQAVPQ